MSEQNNAMNLSLIHIYQRQTMPNHAMPCRAKPGRTEPFPATPWRAAPRRARPHPGTPWHAKRGNENKASPAARRQGYSKSFTANRVM